MREDTTLLSNVPYSWFDLHNHTEKGIQPRPFGFIAPSLPQHCRILSRSSNGSLLSRLYCLRHTCSIGCSPMSSCRIPPGLLCERSSVRLIFIFDAFGTGTPTFRTFEHRNASGRGNFGNFLADSFHTSGPPQSSSAPYKMVDQLWVDSKFHPPASEEHPNPAFDGPATGFTFGGPDIGISSAISSFV